MWWSAAATWCEFRPRLGPQPARKSSAPYLPSTPLVPVRDNPVLPTGREYFSTRSIFGNYKHHPLFTHLLPPQNSTARIDLELPSSGVYRACRMVRPSIYSAKVTAGRRALRHLDRHIMSSITAGAPPTGASASRRAYRPCTRHDTTPASFAPRRRHCGVSAECDRSSRALDQLDHHTGQVRQQPPQTPCPAHPVDAQIRQMTSQDPRQSPVP